MKYDLQLVEMFIRGFGKLEGSSFSIRSWPEAENRNVQAIEAIAVSEAGLVLGIEHTLIQPFVGEKQDTAIFSASIAPLENHPELLFQDRTFYLMVEVGAIPTGVDWRALPARLKDWLKHNLESLPDGISQPDLSGIVGFQFTPRIRSETNLGLPSHFWVARSLPDDTFEAVLRQALNRKLQKLVNAPVELRVLLLEKCDIAQAYSKFPRAIEALQDEFPDLRKLTAIWLVTTSAWESEGIVWFREVWPNYGARRFECRELLLNVSARTD